MWGSAITVLDKNVSVLSMYTACVQSDYNMTQIYALSRSFSCLRGLSYTPLLCLMTLQTAVTDPCALIHVHLISARKEVQ
jgi:hypothetical protein